MQLQKERKAKKTQNLEDSILPLSSKPLQDPDKSPLLSAAKSKNSQAALVKENYTSNQEIISRRMWEITKRNNMPHQNVNQQKLMDFVLGIENGSESQKIFFKNVLRPKFSWIRPLLSGKKDLILINFIDSVLNLKM